MGCAARGILRIRTEERVEPEANDRPGSGMGVRPQSGAQVRWPSTT